MERVGQEIVEVERQGELFKKALESGDMKWEDETIQFFIPLILHFTNFDWLRLIAENNLVEEDEVVVKNYLDMVQSLMKLNQEQLEQEVHKKMEKLLKLMGVL